VAAPGEAQGDAAVGQAFASHALAHTRLVEQIYRALLKHTGPDARLDIGAAARLDDYGGDALQVQQVRQH
jgi:hypothetical protein